MRMTSLPLVALALFGMPIGMFMGSASAAGTDTVAVTGATATAAAVSR